MLKKISVLLFFCLIFLVQNTGAQVFRGVSFKIGFSLKESGYTYENETIKRFFHKEPSVLLTFLGFSGEFFYSKYLSTVVDAAYRPRMINYEYDKLNGMGQSTGTREINNSVSYIAFSGIEKLHYDFSYMSVYVFLGMRVEMKIGESIDEDFAFLNNLKNNIFCLTSGLGFAAQFSKIRVMVEADYDNDLNAMYESGTEGSGKIKLSNFGIRLGVGYYLPIKKK